MKIETYKVEIPDYALSYLINDDSSGIDEAEIKLIDEFMQEYYDEAKKVKGSVIIDVIDEEGSFNAFPEFGLACNTFSCNIHIIYR